MISLLQACNRESKNLLIKSAACVKLTKLKQIQKNVQYLLLDVINEPATTIITLVVDFNKLEDT